MRTSVDVHNALVERDAPHELVPIRGRFRRPDRIAAIFGLDPGAVGRVVLFEGDGRIVAAALPATARPDSARVASAAGIDRVKEVRAARASDLTGYLPEALPPVGLPQGVSLLLDERFAADAVLYFPGGEPTSVLKIRGDDLIRATGASVARLSKKS
jgi:Cys-tRNA(Pro)/Cys-tRNA(Cys) deacylase